LIKQTWGFELFGEGYCGKRPAGYIIIKMAKYKRKTRKAAPRRRKAFRSRRTKVKKYDGAVFREIHITEPVVFKAAAGP